MFKQLCVWPGTVVGKENVEEFEKGMLKEFGVRIKYDSEVETNPDTKDGLAVPDTGGRNDLFFYVHEEDVGIFAIPRLQVGIRWWEDVLGNGHEGLYSEQFLKEHPKTW